MGLRTTSKYLQAEIKTQLLTLYDLEEGFHIRLLKYSENIIYKITFPAKSSVVFRVHRPGYHDYEELEAELIWMEELNRDTNLSLPKIYRGRDGRALQVLKVEGEDYYCSVVSFLEGRMIGELHGKELEERLEEIGTISAKLHLQSIGRNSEKRLKRFHWDISNLFGNEGTGIWGSWRDYEGIRKEQEEVLRTCEKAMIQRLNRYGRGAEHFGLIHGDLHFFNIINDGKKNQIFDFDDCGYGFYLYDLGCTLVTYSKHLTRLTNAWIKGYEKVRQLSLEEKELLPMFILIRRMARLAWLSTHSDSDTARTVEESYLTVTIRMAEQWLMEEGVTHLGSEKANYMRKTANIIRDNRTPTPHMIGV